MENTQFGVSYLMSGRLSSPLHITCLALTNNLAIFSCSRRANIVTLLESLSLLSRGVFWKRVGRFRCQACYDCFGPPPLALDWPGDVSLRKRLGWKKQEHGRIYWEQFPCKPVQEFVSSPDFAGPKHDLHFEWCANLWHRRARQTMQPLSRYAELAQCIVAIWIFWQQLLPLQGVTQQRQGLRAALWLRW